MSEIRELARRIAGEATGNEQIEVVVASGSDTNVTAYQGSVEKFTSATSAGFSIRVLLDGPSGARIGTASTGALDDEAVAEALAQARDNARFATEDEFLAFARPDGVAAPEIDLVSPHFDALSTADKIEMALELERATRAGDGRIRQVQAATYVDYRSASVIVSSLGIDVETAETGAYLSVAAIAHENGENHSGYGLSVGRAGSELSVDTAARDAIRRSTEMLGAVKAPSTRTTAVFDSRTASELLSIISSALSGDMVVRGRSFFAGRVGEKVAADAFTLVDDPTDIRHFAASPVDGEGLASRRNALITSGTLTGFVYDTVSARRAGTASTGNALRGGVTGCRALQLLPGTDDFDAIIRQVGEGIVVRSLRGVHSGVNPISGDFSVGITGRMIRHGQLAEPVREVTIASSLQKMLLDVVAIGDDIEWLPGLAAGQTIAISDITVTGS